MRSVQVSRSSAVLVLMVAMMWTCGAVESAFASYEELNRPGTISHALSVSDGTQVVLDDVIVEGVCSPYIFVREPWSFATLPVLANAAVQKGSVLEVSGCTATILGTRIVTATGLRRYATVNGGSAAPIPKWTEVFDWPYMDELPLGLLPNVPVAISSNLLEATSESTLLLPSMVNGPITLTGMIVTAGRGDDLSDNTFYIERTDRAFGWKVVYTGATQVCRGCVVDVVGVTAVDTDLQDAYINASSVTHISTGDLPKPLGMVNRSLGGMDDGLGRPGVTGSFQTYNKGLLVTCWGKVTSVNETEDSFFMDDGSGSPGVKVRWDEQAVSDLNPAIVPPQVDWYVFVTGISSCENTADGIIRVLRPRRQEDIVAKIPADTSAPSVQITDPEGATLLKLPSTTSAAISGTAVDSETSVAHVQVKMGSGDWHTADYDSATHVWTYTWENPSSANVQVRAMDLAGHMATTSRDVTVSAPQVIYVSKSGNDGNSGWTWSDAKLTIQHALDTAVSEGEMEVWVASGTYNERIVMRSGKGLYGGFEGDEIARAERPAFPRQDSDPIATVLDGQQAGTVVRAGTVDAFTTIDGFTITNSGTSYSGIYCDGTGTPSIANNTISANGTGVRFYRSTDPLVGWVHHNNITENGTGVLCEGPGSVVVEDNRIHHNGNTTAPYGIGIRINGGASPTIERNWIEYNGSASSGLDGGGIWCANSSTAYIYNNVIRGNVAKNGGGVYITGVSTVRMYNNTVVSNQAVPFQGNGGAGGAVYSYTSAVTIANNVLYNNSGSFAVNANDVLIRVYAYNNCAYANTGGDYSSWVTVTNCHHENPNLGANGVYLTSSSAYCINAGSGAYCHGPGDIDGDDRIWNGVVDVGADEYGSP